MQPLGPTISATRVGQHPNPSVSDLHGPTWPTRMTGKARHSELIANGNALCAIEYFVVEERYARAPRYSDYQDGGPIMKKLGMLGIIGGAAILTAVPFSLQWSQKNVTVSLASAEAQERLTATSVAGVSRR